MIVIGYILKQLLANYKASFVLAMVPTIIKDASQRNAIASLAFDTTQLTPRNKAALDKLVVCYSMELDTFTGEFLTRQQRSILEKDHNNGNNNTQTHTA